MLLVFVWVYLSSEIEVTAQSQTTSGARALDALLQDYAYRAFIRPRTGVAYNGLPPSNFTGIQISAMRLRSGSLRRRGVSAYKEFRIPKGLIEQPYVERLVLVYQNLGNWSSVYYPLPSGYRFVAPVLGLLAYDAYNLSAKHLPQLTVRASGQPISIEFSVPNGLVAKCVSFDLNGSFDFSSIVSGNMCSTFQLGHFSVVTESISPAPSPMPVGPPAPPQTGRGKKNHHRVGIIVGSVLGGMGLIILLGILVLWIYKCRHKKKMRQMETAAEAGESLEMTLVGNMRAPSATVTRTQPSLETEDVS